MNGNQESSGRLIVIYILENTLTQCGQQTGIGMEIFGIVLEAMDRKDLVENKLVRDLRGNAM